MHSKSHFDQTREDRIIRVFVSSTFRDMQAERDELVLTIRDPTFIDRLSEKQKREDFVSENDQSLQKLNRLKDDIRQQHREAKLKYEPREEQSQNGTSATKSRTMPRIRFSFERALADRIHSKFDSSPHSLSGTTQRRRDLSPRIL